MEDNNLKTTYKLTDIIKEIRLTRKHVPVTKVILGFLKGTEFDNGSLSVSTEYNLENYKKCKKYIDTAIKNHIQLLKEQNKLDKNYLYISIGGTKELDSQFRIEAKDHFTSRVLSPKGCDKYCTENQIGKPQNWVKLPIIMMPRGDYFDLVKKYLNDKKGELTKISNNVYHVESSALYDRSFIEYMAHLQNEIFQLIEYKWVETNYDI